MAHVPNAPATEKSEDDIQEEIKRYLKFEGGRGELQAPLMWWKVSGMCSRTRTGSIDVSNL
jgi:hypothetical protein